MQVEWILEQLVAEKAVGVWVCGRELMWKEKGTWVYGLGEGSVITLSSFILTWQPSRTTCGCAGAAFFLTSMMGFWAVLTPYSWLRGKERSWRQACRIWCLWWLSLPLFSSCFPSITCACSSSCIPAGCSCPFLFLAGLHAADAHHLLNSSCFTLLLAAHSAVSPPAWQRSHLLPLGNSVTLLPFSFPYPLCLKEGWKTICSIFMSQMVHLSLFFLQNNSVMTWRTVPEAPKDLVLWGKPWPSLHH